MEMVNALVALSRGIDAVKLVAAKSSSA